MQLRSDQSKDGAILGRKGTETRARLLAATRTLLETLSPFNLTVAAIAKAAKTAPATLYVYFDDVQDVFYALNIEAQQDFESMTNNHPEWFSDPVRIQYDAQQFVDEFNSVWDRHHHALQYRNLESDRGNTRFLALRTSNALPLIDRLAHAVKAAKPGISNREAYADAIVLFSGVERMAATRDQIPSDQPRLPADELSAAQARVIARYLSSGG
ncbi:TetR family transcriptional regulator [Sphingobium sp.]|uniref:TetR family transcriptional regulator n=1 Tax=Sphingobium sp. TaxID=1912891 RepID=UPI002CBCBF4B|nr:TetR family transcriptional regulator [Sphingobium sp.]HUD90651.1 TetR family transcriptional regulator [Sphingobium sp.]